MTRHGVALVFLFVGLCPAAANAADPLDDVTAALTAEVMQKPEVQQAIQGVAPSPRPMIEIGGQTQAQAQPQARGRSDRHLGVDAHVGLPLGAGVELRYTIVAPITVGVSLDTTGLAYSVTAEATVNILPIFTESRWTPTVSVAFTHLRFTGMSDAAWQKFGPQFAAQGVEVNLQGMWMNAISVLAGVDYVSPRGFHFSVSAGRLFQVGDSGGRDMHDGVLLRGWQSYILSVGVGYVF